MYTALFPCIFFCHKLILGSSWIIILFPDMTLLLKNYNSMYWKKIFANENGFLILSFFFTIISLITSFGKYCNIKCWNGWSLMESVFHMYFWYKTICHSKIFGCLNTLYTEFSEFSLEDTKHSARGRKRKLSYVQDKMNLCV